MSALTAKINIAKSQLGLDEDTYRGALELATGKRSLREMSGGELIAALKHFEAKGFKPMPKREGGRRKLDGKYTGKLRALWIAGWNLGLIRNPDDAAMLAFLKRQAKVDDTRFLHDPADGRAAIEGLKSWLARAGVDLTHSSHTPDEMRTSGFKIAFAQYRILNEAGHIGKNEFGFMWQCCHLSGHREMETMTRERDWIDVMNAFGVRVRAMKKAAGK
jgi:hypothetical protein